jgi:hypothetical protein
VSAVLPVRGSAFGFNIHSPFAFETLLPPADLSPLMVVPAEGEPAGTGDLLAEISEPGFRAQIFGQGTAFSLWVEQIGWFRVDPAAACVEAPTEIDPFVREELVLGLPALLCFLERGDASLHAAAIDIGGQAVVLVAPQGHGKSTLAAAFCERGYRVLTEDLACIRLKRQPVVLPGPTSIRVRNDVAADVGKNLVCRRVGLERTRYAPRTQATEGQDQVPVAAVILLKLSSGDVRLEDIDPVQALPDLWGASFRLTREHERRAFSALGRIAETVPIQQLFRPLTIDALDRTVARVVAEAEQRVVERSEHATARAGTA